MIAQGRGREQENVPAQGDSHRGATTINMLPENVLLEIFNIYRKDKLEDVTRHYLHRLGKVWEWHLLVHVCEKWRQIIFASPLRLNLRILCTYRTPITKNLGIWPAFPIIVDSYPYTECSLTRLTPNGEANVIAALKHFDRVCGVGLSSKGSQFARIAGAMQESFPVLNFLFISSAGRNAPVLPTEFLRGSAPCLQNINLDGISYPTLPTLLLSTRDLVTLSLSDIPSTGYISPETMVASLAALPKLRVLTIEFKSSTPYPDRIQPPCVTRIVLPALTSFRFMGSSEYLEDLVAPINGPQLNNISISSLDHFDLQVTQLSKFIDRSGTPELTPRKQADVTFSSHSVTFDMYDENDERWAEDSTIISCQEIDWDQVPYMTEVLSRFSQYSSRLSNVFHLKLETEPNEDLEIEDTDDVEWLHLLHQFSNVQTLHVSRELAGFVAFALEHIVEETDTEVLPSLALIYLAGQPASSLENFLAARRLSDRPITVVNTKRKFDRKHKSYVSK